jgi:hypothetical protein
VRSVLSKCWLSDHDSCANGYYDGGVIGGKVVTCLNVSVCGRDAVSNEEIQEVHYFVGVGGPVCQRRG